MAGFRLGRHNSRSQPVFVGEIPRGRNDCRSRGDSEPRSRRDRRDRSSVPRDVRVRRRCPRVSPRQRRYRSLFARCVSWRTMCSTPECSYFTQPEPDKLLDDCVLDVLLAVAVVRPRASTRGRTRGLCRISGAQRHGVDPLRTGHPFPARLDLFENFAVERSAVVCEPRSSGDFALDASFEFAALAEVDEVCRRSRSLSHLPSAPWRRRGGLRSVSAPRVGRWRTSFVWRICAGVVAVASSRTPGTPPAPPHPFSTNASAPASTAQSATRPAIACPGPPRIAFTVSTSLSSNWPVTLSVS